MNEMNEKVKKIPNRILRFIKTQSKYEAAIFSNKKITITRDEFLNFIKKKNEGESISSHTQHYLSYFDKLKDTGVKGNWNWLGFIPLWFFYRRMYSLGFSLAFTSKLLDKILQFTFKHINLGALEDYLEFGIHVLFILLCMRYADYLYVKHVNYKISKEKTQACADLTDQGLRAH